MTTAMVWGGPKDGLVVSTHGCALAVPKKLKPTPWYAVSVIGASLDYEVYDFHQRYWPGLGIENLWLRNEDYQRLLEQERDT